ncbi:MAG: hypothetical protein VKP62_07955 [Candidatus Sericytochromatia bacterium]|nr:hypothetical protein [Candidatus Sericytochromatia bacterium]
MQPENHERQPLVERSQQLAWTDVDDEGDEEEASWLEVYPPWLEWASSVLTPQAAWVAVGAGLLGGVTGCFQFATPLFEWFPWFAYGSWLSVALACVLLASMVVASRRWDRGPLLVVGFSGLSFALALASVGAKSHWQRGLSGNPFYTLPAQTVAYEVASEEVSLRTSDGVDLRATYLGARRPFALLYVPSWRAHRRAFAVVALASWWANDFDVLVLDPRGQGESGGFKTPDARERHDVAAGVAYLRQQGHSRVAVIAEQDAARPAVYAAVEGRNVDALVLLAPTLRWADSLGSQWDPRHLPGRLYWRVAAGLKFGGGPPGPSLVELLQRIAPTPVYLMGTNAEAGSTLDTLYKAAQDPKGLFKLGGDGQPVAWSHVVEVYQAASQHLSYFFAPPQPSAGLSSGE